MRKNKRINRLCLLIANAIGESIEIDLHDRGDYHLSKISASKLVSLIMSIIDRDYDGVDTIEFENAIKSTYHYERQKRLDRFEKMQRELAGLTP